MRLHPTLIDLGMERHQRSWPAWLSASEAYRGGHVAGIQRQGLARSCLPRAMAPSRMRAIASHSTPRAFVASKRHSRRRRLIEDDGLDDILPDCEPAIRNSHNLLRVTTVAAFLLSPRAGDPRVTRSDGRKRRSNNDGHAGDLAIHRNGYDHTGLSATS